MISFPFQGITIIILLVTNNSISGKDKTFLFSSDIHDKSSCDLNKTPSKRLD